MNRRDFVKKAALAAVAGATGARAEAPARTDEIRSVLLHLGRNMWGWTPPGRATPSSYTWRRASRCCPASC